MIDAKKRYQELITENKKLKDMLEIAQRELADSVLSEIQLRDAVRNLSDEVRRLTNSKPNEKA